MEQASICGSCANKPICKLAEQCATIERAVEAIRINANISIIPSPIKVSVGCNYHREKQASSSYVTNNDLCSHIHDRQTCEPREDYIAVGKVSHNER